MVTISQLRVCIDVVLDFRAATAAPRPDVVILAPVQQRPRVEAPVPLVERAAARAVTGGGIPRRWRIPSGVLGHRTASNQMKSVPNEK